MNQKEIPALTSSHQQNYDYLQSRVYENDLNPGSTAFQQLNTRHVGQRRHSMVRIHIPGIVTYEWE